MIAAKTIINYSTTTIILKANNHQYKGISMGVLLHQKERILIYTTILSKIRRKNKMIFISSTVPFDQIHDTYKESQTSGRNY